MKKIILYTCTLLLLLGCSNKETSSSLIYENPIVKNRIELPALSTNAKDLFVSHATEVNGQSVVTYSLEYDCNLRHAKWVAFSFYDATARLGSGRTNAWDDDPGIPEEYRSSRSDFYGYDRGHICASYDRQYSKEANEQTFYYSNMSPQMGNFNQKIWVKLEQKVQNWGRSNTFRNILYVVKGGTIRADQVLEYTGTHNIPVPKYYWMTLVARKNNTYKAIAFWLEHRDYGDGPFNFEDFAISVDELEQKTGFDFFHNLPDNIENEIEAKFDYNRWEYK